MFCSDKRAKTKKIKDNQTTAKDSKQTVNNISMVGRKVSEEGVVQVGLLTGKQGTDGGHWG